MNAAEKVPGVKVICYVSVGSFESYRVDDDARRGIKYPEDWSGVLGKTLDGWPDERWLDIRSPKVKSIMLKRMQYAKYIGCDGFDPDNVDGYTAKTGFPLTSTDQFNYNKWVAQTAQSLGLAVGLKNCLELIKKLHKYYDFFVNESCFVYNECSYYDVVGRSKPVLGVEYCDNGSDTQDPYCYCPRANVKGWRFLVKKYDLGAAGTSCEKICMQGACKAATGTSSCKTKKTNVCSVLRSSKGL